MSATQFSSPTVFASETVEGENATRASHQRYLDLVSTLPKNESGFFPVLRQFRGWWWMESGLPTFLDNVNNFRARPSDVFLASSPKSGTTWIKALTFAVVNRAKYPLDSHQQHPLIAKSPHQLVRFLEIPLDEDDVVPRILATHPPFSLLPDSIKGAKIVYLCREPKDIFVSWFHFQRSFLSPAEPAANIDEAFDFYCAGTVPWGPIWDNMLEYWREHQRRPQQVLCLKYEDLKADAVGSLKKLADFLGCPFDDEEERKGVAEGIVNLCSFENLMSLETNKSGKLPFGVVDVDKKQFFRRGETGDWANHLTTDMAERLDQIVNQKLHGTGLKF